MLEPSSEELLRLLPSTDAAELDACVSKAEGAAHRWQSLSLEERGGLLGQLAGIDAVRVDDDEALLGLAENLREADDGEAVVRLGRRRRGGRDDVA